MANYICQNRHGTFYFRFIIPIQIRRYFKQKREIRYSLKTDSKKVAVLRARLYRVRFDRVLERLHKVNNEDDETFSTGLMTHLSIFGDETKVSYGDDKEKELEAITELKKKDIALAREMGLDPIEIIKLKSTINVSSASIQARSLM